MLCGYELKGGAVKCNFFVDCVVTQIINSSMLLRQGSDILCSSWWI